MSLLTKKFIVHKKIYYYQDFESARSVRDRLQDEGFYRCRVVSFDRGWGVQKYEGGPYWGDAAESEFSNWV